MKMIISSVAYILETPSDLMQKIRSEANYWSEGDENICLTTEQAMEIEELHPFLKDIPTGCDIIVSK